MPRWLQNDNYTKWWFQELKLLKPQLQTNCTLCKITSENSRDVAKLSRIFCLTIRI